MKLIGFSAKKYRSISTAYKLPLTEYTVIVGPNNEGKSNILKGLRLALTLLLGGQQQRFKRTGVISFAIRGIDRFDFEWERDFPINIQNSEPYGRSEFICEFNLSELELKEFKQRTKINLNSALKAKISIGRDDVKFDFLMKGKGKDTLNKKSIEIFQFINEKLILQYIPAIRTSDIAIHIVESLLQRELSKLEDNHEFKGLVKEIDKLQQSIIKNIAKNLQESISGFIPDVKKIAIKNRENVGRLINASCRVYIDDGTETDLQLKGDGVISLTAISLLQYFSKQGSIDKGIILLLEEPESHLHPNAIHNLKSVLYEISKSNQVIVTTHSPIIIERRYIKQNIIVQNGKATSARNVTEIRNSLGINMSDNLMSAYVVLLVEGEEDGLLIKSWIEEKSPIIRAALSNASLVVDHLAGATNASYKASFYKNNLCNVVLFLDNDIAGKKGIEDALNKDIIKESEYLLASCRGMSNSELEDLIDFEIYKDLILSEYGVNLNIPAFKNNKKQWSDRVREIFQNCGKNWNSRLEGEIKSKVAKQAILAKLESLNIHKTNCIDSLVKTLETILQK
jgi:putative ATP-dependent endonuclease of OLD family